MTKSGGTLMGEEDWWKVELSLGLSRGYGDCICMWRGVG